MQKQPRPQPTNKKIPKLCAKCPHHQVINDRDPHDWFNDDDCAIICTLVKGRPRPKSLHPADHSQYKVVQCALRPYEVNKVTPPDWCPLRKA